MNFGDRLKQLRKEQNLTQKEMAKILLMESSNYSRYESNNQEPKALLVQKIAEKFAKPINWLYGAKLENNINISNDSMVENYAAIENNKNNLSQEAVTIINNQIKIIESQIQTNKEQAILLQRLIEEIFNMQRFMF